MQDHDVRDRPVRWGWSPVRLSLVLALALVLAGFAPAGAAEPVFRKAVLETDCDDPMELAVLPDGRVMFVERFGKVRIWHPESRSTSLAAELAVHGGYNPGTKGDEDRGSWESGLIGLALAPEFPETGWVYLYYSPQGDYPVNLVSRFTLRGDVLDLASERVVMRVPVQREVCCHEAGSLAFDSQGNLFLSTGDNTNPFQSDGYAPADYREGRYPFDAARSAGNANDLRGKILRVHPEPDGSYTVPEGNLFPPGTPDTRPEIFVMGCRNPFRIAVDPVSGVLSWGDVGPDAREIDPGRGPAGFDEINRTLEAGNFGWPFLIADNKPYRQFDFATGTPGPPQDAARPVNRSPGNTGPELLPPSRPAWIWYPYAPSTRFPETGSGGRTACAGPFYHFDSDLVSDRKLPERYDGVQFIYEWERGWILTVREGADGRPVLERFAPEVALKRPVEMELGSDGALYVIEFGTGWENNRDSQIVRIEPAAGSGSLAGVDDAGGSGVEAGAPGAPSRLAEARRQFADDDREALAGVQAAIGSGELRRQQVALAALGSLQGGAADALIVGLLDRLAGGDLPAELVLDVLDAARRRESPAVQAGLERYRERHRVSDHDTLAEFLDCLEGGDAEAGRRVFVEKLEVSCARCHRTGPGDEDGSVGPDLSQIGALRDRRHLLEAIVQPNASVAPGFEYVLVTMNNGKEYSGLLKAESESEIELESPEDGTLTLSKEEIESRGRGLSAMPEGLGLVLTKFELRDLVEFLAGLKPAGGG